MNIFVGTFPLDTSEESLREAFEHYGEVASVQIIRERRTGESRGFGFVEMPLISQARAAISELDGCDFHGRSLNVSEARPPSGPPRGKGGARGRRRHDMRRRGGRKRGGRRGGGWGF
jgi:RNA recognition motif-containing protein